MKRVYRTWDYPDLPELVLHAQAVTADQHETLQHTLEVNDELSVSVAPTFTLSPTDLVDLVALGLHLTGASPRVTQEYREAQAAHLAAGPVIPDHVTPRDPSTRATRRSRTKAQR